MRRVFIAVVGLLTMVSMPLPADAFDPTEEGVGHSAVFSDAGFVGGSLGFVVGGVQWGWGAFRESCVYSLEWAESAIESGGGFWFDNAERLVVDWGDGSVGSIVWSDRVVEMDYWAGGASCIQEFWSGTPWDCSDADRVGIVGLRSHIDAVTGEVDFTYGSGSDGVGTPANFSCVEVASQPGFAGLVSDGRWLPPVAGVVNPRVRGLTGLETWFWYETANGEDPYRKSFPVTLVTPIDAVRMDVDVWMVELRFDADGDGVWDHVEGCGNSLEVSDVCGGSEGEPLLSYTYRTRAVYDFVVQAHWEGRAVSPFGGVHVVSAADLFAEAVRTYEVASITSSLVAPEG